MLKKTLASITLMASFALLAVPDASAYQRCRPRSRNAFVRSYYAPRPYYRTGYVRSYYARRPYSRTRFVRSYYAPRSYYRNGYSRSYYAPRYYRDRRRGIGRRGNAVLTIAAPAAIGAGVGALIGGGRGAGVGALLGGGGGAAYYLLKNRRNRRY